VSPRESVDAKARRYLGEARVKVDYAETFAVRATARGGAAVYRVSYTGGSWSCDCPARGRCAHLAAVGLIAPRRLP
jgi:hypothetical protein